MILGKYNQSKTITFDLVAPDGVDLIVAATFAAGDIVIMKDEGAEANTTNLPTDEGTGYSLVLTATEMSAARIRIYIIDQTATKVWLDISIGIETYGNASAEHAFDLDTASTAQTGDNYARLGAPAGASTAADIAAVKVDTAATLVDTGTTLPATLGTPAGADMSTDIAAIKTDSAAILVDTAEIGIAGAGLTNIGTIATCTTVTNQVTADMTAISGDSVAADNLEATYDGTGYVDDNAPSTQSQLSGISTGAVASSVSPETYTLTTGVLSSGTVGDVDSLGTPHVHTDSAGALDIVYHHLVGAGTPSNVTLDCYLQGNNDNVRVEAYDWSSATYKKIGEVNGKVAATYESLTFPLNNNMVGTGTDVGKVDIKITDGTEFTLTTATFSLDRMYVSYNQTTGNYARGIEVDTNGVTNTNTVVGVDGVIGNPVTTWAAALTLAGKINSYNFHIHNGSSIALTGNSDNYTIIGENWTMALGGQSIANALIHGCTALSGVSSGTGYKIVNCHFSGATSIDAGWAQDCRLGNVTITLVGIGGYFFQSCFSSTGSVPTFDFQLAVGAQTLCLTPLTGGVIVDNMAVGDLTHIEGGGEFTAAANSTGGTIEFSGDWRVTDNTAGSVTLDGGDIYDNVVATLADTNELQGDWTNGGRLDLLLDSLITEMATATTEPAQGAPGVSVKRGEKIDWLYKMMRNRSTSTSTTISIYNDDATTVDHKITHSDDATTYDRGEMATGP